ncbi:MAG: hypothetical protein K940chlam8_00796 [Chlamydiae bacterium]|nr:hypothetical protein [Chlamydiota bacterium]
MFKKLVKYGNSNALVLDRSILALLNISEGSVLKLRIEGDALIIKAADVVKPTESLMLDMENLHDKIPSSTWAPTNSVMGLAEENMRKFCKKVEKDPSAMEELKEWLPGTENSKKLEEAYKKIMPKYQNEFKLLSGKGFKEDFDTLNKKYQGDTTSKEFFEEFRILRLKHAPKLAEFDKEMKEASISLGYPADFFIQ